MKATLTATKVKTGWVLRSKNTSAFAVRQMNTRGRVTTYPGPFYPVDPSGSEFVENAYVYLTRKKAREEKSGSEVARKVSVDDNGKAIEIIRGR